MLAEKCPTPCKKEGKLSRRTILGEYVEGGCPHAVKTVRPDGSCVVGFTVMLVELHFQRLIDSSPATGEAFSHTPQRVWSPVAQNGTQSLASRLQLRLGTLFEV